MASVEFEIETIVKEARKIGWEVEEGNSGQDWAYRIISEDNYVVQLHRTPSDRNSKKDDMRQLNMHGFGEALQNWAETDDRRRIALIQADRAKNEEETLKAQRNAQKRHEEEIARSRAAGPYAPQAVEEEWIFGKHEFPEHKRVLKIHS